mmetsp:Transcript_4508/g.8793  ORF Transcript_4508/g.8793 Transcript_4508/m.8793 type:complete len:220 (+) Transcript_4508:544-1203(+)
MAERIFWRLNTSYIYLLCSKTQSDYFLLGRVNFNTATPNENIAHALQPISGQSNNTDITIQIRRIHGQFIRIKKLTWHGTVQHTDEALNVLRYLRSTGQFEHVIPEINIHSCALVDGVIALDGEGSTGIEDGPVLCQIPPGHVDHGPIVRLGFHSLDQLPQSKSSVGNAETIGREEKLPLSSHGHVEELQGLHRLVLVFQRVDVVLDLMELIGLPRHPR